MKTIILFFILISVNLIQAQVAVNNTGNTPNTNAMLDISSNTKGILIPRFTTADRTNLAASLSASEDGLTVYDTDTKSFWFWDGTTWNQIGSNTSSSDKDWFKTGTTDSPTDINDDIYHMGNVAIGKNTPEYRLDITDDSKSSVLKVNQANTDTSILRISGFFNSNGPMPTSLGKIGVYSALGGNIGNTNYDALTGFETDIIGSNKNSYGYVSDISGNNDVNMVGDYNYIHNSQGTGATYGVLNYLGFNNNTEGIIYSYYTFIDNSKDGIHFGQYQRIGGTGNGSQFGAFNRILNTGTGKQIGVVNEIKNNGTAIHVGTLNSIGAGVHENNPTSIDPITNDSNGKRVGAINIVAGNGSGIHIAEGNAVFSTGNGLHIGIGNSLGYDPTNQTPTQTTGKHIGIFNTLSDIGNASHAGTVNILGAYVTQTAPTTPIPVSGDSDAKRIGNTDVIMGDGNGEHITSLNNILSTGNGKHIGGMNIIGYNYANHTPTNTTGNHFGTVNNLNDRGSGIHNGTFNIIGLDLLNNSEINSNGTHIGTNNVLAGGHVGNQLQGLQIANLNSIIAKSDASNMIVGGRQYGNLNIIGRDLLNNPSVFIDNGDGDHFGTYNEVSDLGNGTHVGSYNVAKNNGNGRHIAVYGEVDDNDNKSWAGMFKGYTTSKNQVSTINLWSGNEYTVFQNTNSDLNLMEAGFNPVIYQLQGLVQIKVFVRVSNASGLGNQFQLHAINNASDVTPITTSDTWTWNNTSSGKYIVESQWKAWNAGTDIWELHLYGITDGSSTMKITNVYVMIRPFQIVGKP